MDKDDFKDPQKVAAYFQPAPGRPADCPIKESILDMVACVGPYAEPDDWFLTNDICLKVRLDYPGQGIYIAFRVKYLVKTGQVPLKRVGTRGTRVLYAIVL